MSVLKNKRHEARTEYEEKYKRFYAYMSARLGSVPKRRKRWLGVRIESELNRVYECAISITEANRQRYSALQTQKDQTVVELLQALLRLSKPLTVLCNVMEYEDKSIMHMYSLIDEFGLCAAKQHSYIKYIPLQSFKPWLLRRVEFGANMMKLHKYTHGKVVKLSNKHAETSGALLINLVDTALYCVSAANDIFPTNQQQFLMRQKLIETAIVSLQGMNRPMISLYALCGYSNEVQIEWAKMLNDEIQLLRGLRESDRKRFGRL